jgi:hypothetical protein
LVFHSTFGLHLHLVLCCFPPSHMLRRFCSLFRIRPCRAGETLGEGEGAAPAATVEVVEGKDDAGRGTAAV